MLLFLVHICTHHTSVIKYPFLDDSLTDAANNIRRDIPQSTAGHISVADEADLNECCELLPFEVVLGQGPHVLNRI